MMDLAGQSFRSYLLEKKINALMHGSIVPDDLIAAVEDFRERNAIVETGENKKICCQQCLKAYALKKAEELEIGKNAMAAVERMIPGKAGHDGYFIDEDRLLSLN